MATPAAQDNPAAEPKSSGSLHPSISIEKRGEEMHFFFENTNIAAITVTIQLDLDNLGCTMLLPPTFSLLSHEKEEWFVLREKEPNSNWAWTNTYFATMGTANATPNAAYIYGLPYAPGSSFRVNQGFNSAFTHFGENKFAIDFGMPLGTPVHAIRSGIVVDVKSDSDRGGGDPKYEPDANYILVEHADHTIAEYAHLQKRGVNVSLGQFVERGDRIGLSGSTGYATGPHLHLRVFKARDGKHRESIRIQFETAESSAITLVQGGLYKAPSKSWASAVTLAGASHALR